MEIATKKFCIRPEKMKVISDVSLEVSHKEVAREVNRKAIVVKIGPNHSKEPSIGVVGLVRKETNQAGKVDSNIQSHKNKHLREPNIKQKTNTDSVPGRIVLDRF